MKILKFKLLIVLIALFAYFSGCKSDTVAPESAYVGNYTISHAETADILTITTVEMGALPIPPSTDITEAIQNALLSSVKCSSADKSYIELRKDNSMFASCELQNELNAGTWEEVNATTLKLNMNNAAIPSSPTGFLLTVTDIVKSTTGMRGKTSVPLPKEMIASMVSAMASKMGVSLTLAPSTPSVVSLSFYLDFVKK